MRVYEIENTFVARGGLIVVDVLGVLLQNGTELRFVI